MSAYIPLPSSFNPHSPLLANELLEDAGATWVASKVSIHIRHCWRMNYDDDTFDSLDTDWFQSTFAIAGE